jgi:lipopolysaccharide transport system ATP-binding protein
LSNESKIVSERTITNNSAYTETAHILKYRIVNNMGQTSLNFSIDEEVGIEIIFIVIKSSNDLVCGINLFNRYDLHLFSSHDSQNRGKEYTPGTYMTTVWIPRNILSEGLHLVSAALMTYNPFQVLEHDINNVGFNVADKQDGTTVRGEYSGGFPGVVRPRLKWEEIKTHH